MRRWGRRQYLWAAASLLGFLAVVVGLASLADPYPAQEEDPSLRRLSAHSDAGSGARALYLWLDRLGYRPASIEYQLFSVDPAARALLVLAPSEDPTEAQVAEIMGWLEKGGNLLLAGDRSGRLHESLGVEVVRDRALISTAVPRQPLLLGPGIGEVSVDTNAELRFLRPEWVPLLGRAGEEELFVAGVATFGRGRVMVLSGPMALSNSNIGRGDNWALVQTWLRGVPAGSAVLFDEYHHGLTEHGTLTARMWREPWGWAVVYTAATIFVFMALRGRRFGGAVPVYALRARRSRLEYVTTMAGLFRQGGHLDWLCRHFAEQVKRSLAHKYRLRPDTNAREFARELASLDPAARAIAAPLERLERVAIPGDRAALELIREVDGLRAKLLDG